jgi:hypothetical protein
MPFLDIRALLLGGVRRSSCDVVYMARWATRCSPYFDPSERLANRALQDRASPALQNRELVRCPPAQGSRRTLRKALHPFLIDVILYRHHLRAHSRTTILRNWLSHIDRVGFHGNDFLVFLPGSLNLRRAR